MPDARFLKHRSHSPKWKMDNRLPQWSSRDRTENAHGNVSPIPSGWLLTLESGGWS